jgi:formylglycine-generating enzyme required for sulfatase activity
MKNQRFNIRAVFCVLLLSFCAQEHAFAQTNGALSLEMFPGITITGVAGSNYIVQFSTNLAQSTNWQTLTNVTLAGSSYFFVDTNAVSRRFYRLETNNAGHPSQPPGMALIAAGSFVMGDSIDGETDAPTENVSVSAFYIDTNLVTYSLWQQVCGWAATNGYVFDGIGVALGTNYPVQTVNWFDAVRWCNARSQMASLAPVYYTDAGLTQVYKTGDVAVNANWTNAGYRLPTEAEWEKAARGGNVGERFPWGNFISESQANYYGDPLASGNGYSYDSGPAGYNAAFYTGFVNYFNGYSSPVRSFAPNGYGLNDMAGNTFQWCWDWYGPYPNGPLTDPHGAASGTNRITRGGSWLHFADQCRTAFRNNDLPTFADDELGFRTVILPPSQ